MLSARLARHAAASPGSEPVDSVEFQNGKIKKLATGRIYRPIAGRIFSNPKTLQFRCRYHCAVPQQNHNETSLPRAEGS